MAANAKANRPRERLFFGKHGNDPISEVPTEHLHMLAEAKWMRYMPYAKAFIEGELAERAAAFDSEDAA